jgi:hypothetical protein
MSKKMVASNHKYKILREIYLFNHPLCEVCSLLGKDPSPATQIHHKARRGVNHNKIETFMATCFYCHRHIHDNPAWAKENSLLIK